MSGIAGAFSLDGPAVEVSDTRVSFDGRLDNREEFVADPAASDAAAVLAAYEQFGDGFVSHLNGDFALALVDARRQRLFLARDVCASRPLYYCQVPGQLLFASEITSLLADPRVSASPDEDGLADLVLNHWCDGRRTCFKGISSVPPGLLVVAGRDGVEVRVHWAFDPFRQIRYRTFEEYRDAFRSLFEQAVRRRLRSDHPVGVTVSGGVDSSSVFCQAATLIRRDSLPVSLRGVAMTYPMGTAADEQSFLDDIERMYDVPIARLPVSHLEFLAGADAVVRRLETPTLVPKVQADIFEHAHRDGCRVVLSGYFGDQMLFDRGYLIDLARRGQWRQIRHDLREFAAWTTDEDPAFFPREFRGSLLRELPSRALLRLAKRLVGRWRARDVYSPLFTNVFRERAHALALARSLTRGRFATTHAEHCFAHAAAGHYVINVMRESGVGRMQGVDVRYPFRDRDLVAFLMAIPGEIVNWQGVPKGLLRHALSGVLPDAIRDRRWKADFTDLNEQALAKSRADLARLVPRDSLAVRAGFADGDMIERGHTAGIDWRTADPVGLEIWLRCFFGSGAAAG